VPSPRRGGRPMGRVIPSFLLDLPGRAFARSLTRGGGNRPGSPIPACTWASPGARGQLRRRTGTPGGGGAAGQRPQARRKSLMATTVVATLGLPLRFWPKHRSPRQAVDQRSADTGAVTLRSTDPAARGPPLWPRHRGGDSPRGNSVEQLTRLLHLAYADSRRRWAGVLCLVPVPRRDTALPPGQG